MIRRLFVGLLQYQGQLDMHKAIQDAFLHNFQTFLGAHVETVNPLLTLRVDRHNIVDDTIKQVRPSDVPLIQSMTKLLFDTVG
jgi:hypothetical protein